jgi:hypothetical protein
VWFAVSPIVAAGVLSGHLLAYRLTGTRAESVHGYLDHAPQVLLILAVLASALALASGRLRAPAVWQFPAAGAGCFVVQEHVERLAHSGELPWLLTSPAFVLGVLLQLPVAIVVWMLARRLLRALPETAVRRRRLPRLPHLLLDVAAPAVFDVPPRAAAPLPGRGPPLCRRP